MGLKLKFDEKGQPLQRKGNWVYEDDDGNEQEFPDPLQAHAKNQQLIDESKKAKARATKAEELGKRLGIFTELDVENDDQLRDLVAKGREAMAGTHRKAEPDEIQKAVEARAKEFERAQKKREEEFRAKEVAFTERETRLRTRLESALVDGPGISAFLALKGKAKSQGLAALSLKGVARMVEEDGEIAVRVFDEDGQIRYKGGTRQPMTLEDLWEERRETEEFAPLFEGNGYVGPEAKGNQRPSLSGRARRVDPTDRTGLRENFDAIGDGEVLVG